MAGLFAAIWLGMRGAVAIKDGIQNLDKPSYGFKMTNGSYLHFDKNGAMRNEKGEHIVKDGRYYRTYYRGFLGRIVDDDYSDKNAKSLEFSKEQGYMAHFGYAWETEWTQLIENSTGKIITKLTRRPVTHSVDGFKWYYLRNSDGSIQQDCKKYYLDVSKPEIVSRGQTLNKLRNGIDCYSGFLCPFEEKSDGWKNVIPVPISEDEFEKLNMPTYLTPTKYTTGYMSRLDVFDEKKSPFHVPDHEIESEEEHEYIKRLKDKYGWFVYRQIDDNNYSIYGSDLIEMTKAGLITSYGTGYKLLVRPDKWRFYFNRELTKEELKNFKLTSVKENKMEGN